MKITLCGSTRFMPSFHEWNLRLTKAGHLVYSVAAATTSADGGSNLDPELKLVLDAVHIAKIEESDAVFVITAPHELVDQVRVIAPYIGESGAREIYYAQLRGKQVLYDYKFRLRYPPHHTTLDDRPPLDEHLTRSAQLPSRPWQT